MKGADIYCVQHLLPSSVEMFDNVSSEFDRSKIFIYGKHYSTVQRVLENLSGRFSYVGGTLSDLARTSLRHEGGASLILDEGGRLHDQLVRHASNQIAGVEQTTSGMRARWNYPTVLVCRSAAKLMFESQIIVRGLLRKLQSLDVLESGVIGVIGAGALGGELSRRLVEQGYPVVLHDKFPPRGVLAPLYRSMQELLSSSSLVLGVTGCDCLSGIPLGGLQPSVTFVSCSSSKIEFASVLRRLAPSGEFDTATGSIGPSSVSVLNGGYPINFDRQTEWEAPEEIWLTRQLCFEGLIQAETLLGGVPRGVMLEPSVQARLVRDWLDRVPEPETLRLPGRLDEDYFRTRSEGEYQMNMKPTYQLHSTTPGALEKMRQHSEPYEVQVGGISITVLPNVWSPRYDWSSEFYIENFPDVEGRSFLEIGSGTGVISVYAGLHGACRVVAVDVNPDAVRNTGLNFERHELGNAEAMLSEGFDQVGGRFDVVTWNAPYHGNRPADPLERGCSDEGYRGIRAFFCRVGDHLNPGGSIVFGFSESGDLPLIRTLIRDAGYRVKREFSDWRQDYNCMLFELVPSKA